MWWSDAVVYQVYPRSFQDSDGDGIGDLSGIRARLGHLVELGVDALWLSPIYRSPQVDFGYDVADYTAVDPAFGTLAEFDALAAEARACGLRLLMDFVPCHTSTQHRWFREHPDWYIWADSRDGGPPNNWVSAFGGPAWSYDERRGRWYLHSFYPQQADLDWRNPELVAAMQGVLRFWLERGVDGFRVDAIDRLLKDARLRDDPPRVHAHGLPVSDEEAELALSMSRNAPDTGTALARIREAVGDALLVGELYLPTTGWQPYLEYLDVVFAFQLMHSPWEANALREAVVAASSVPGRNGAAAAWVLSNHDFGRLATRFGRENDRAALLLLLTLPGMAFLYQGDEIGLESGPGVVPPLDRAGRDPHRHPMQWDGSPGGGFSNGRAWLPPLDPEVRNVEDQRRDPRSVLTLVRSLIRLRRELGAGFELLDAAPGLVAYRRGAAHVVAVNASDRPRPLPGPGEPVLESAPGAVRDDLAPHAGVVLRTR